MSQDTITFWGDNSFPSRFVMYPGLSTGAIVGIAVGGVVAVIVAAVMIMKRKRKIHTTNKTLSNIASSEHPDAENSSRRNSSRMDM